MELCKQMQKDDSEARWKQNDIEDTIYGVPGKIKGKGITGARKRGREHKV